jgi:integrase
MTKNESDRYVHLNQTAVDSLIALRENCRNRGFKFQTLFYDKQHTAIKDPSEWFEAACEEAGVEGVTWHTLRHTFASRCIMAGIDLKTLQVLMGHKTIAMTARYAHLFPGHLKTALTKLDPSKKKNPTSKRTAA